MRKAMIIAWARRESDKPDVLSGAEVPYLEQKKKFQEMKATRVDSKYSRIEFWSSQRGVVFTHRYRTATEQKKIDKAAQKAAEAQRKADMKAKKAAAA